MVLPIRLVIKRLAFFGRRLRGLWGLGSLRHILRLAWGSSSSLCIKCYKSKDTTGGIDDSMIRTDEVPLPALPAIFLSTTKRSLIARAVGLTVPAADMSLVNTSNINVIPHTPGIRDLLVLDGNVVSLDQLQQSGY